MSNYFIFFMCAVIAMIFLLACSEHKGDDDKPIYASAPLVQGIMEMSK